MNSKNALKHNIIQLQKKRIEKMRTCEKPYYVDVLGKKIRVERGVFYPASDTKLLIQSIRIKQGENVLEPFAGTGAISLFIAPKANKTTATDINPLAVRNIQQNIREHGLATKMNALHVNLFPPGNQKFDVIVINPPYTDKKAQNIMEKSVWDEKHATVQRFFKKAKKYLTTKGRIYSSWANFADFTFFEKMVRENKYRLKRTHELTQDEKTYRVYEITPLKP